MYKHLQNIIFSPSFFFFHQHVLFGFTGRGLEARLYLPTLCLSVSATTRMRPRSSQVVLTGRLVTGKVTMVHWSVI